MRELEKKFQNALMLFFWQTIILVEKGSCQKQFFFLNTSLMNLKMAFINIIFMEKAGKIAKILFILWTMPMEILCPSIFMRCIFLINFLKIKKLKKKKLSLQIGTLIIFLMLGLQ